MDVGCATGRGVSDVRLALASLDDARRGLYGFVSFRLDLLRVDGVALRRTREGELRLSFPARRDRGDRRHAYLRPVSDAARRQIESEVFEALALGEVAR